MRILVTGGCGFIGSNFVLHMLRERPDAEIVNLDALTYAGNLSSLADALDNPRHRFVRGDANFFAERRQLRFEFGKVGCGGFGGLLSFGQIGGSGFYRASKAASTLRGSGLTRRDFGLHFSNRFLSAR